MNIYFFNDVYKDDREYIALSHTVVCPQNGLAHGESNMIHGMHTEGSSQIHGLLIEKVWDDLKEEQKTELVKDMIDGKIMMKKSILEHIEHEIQMMEKMKEFISESKSESD